MSSRLYILKNDFMPGMFKVGFTTVTGNSRVDSLSAAVPQDFEIVAEYEFPATLTYGELHSLEREAHRRLQEFRFSPSKEFFTATEEQIRLVLEGLKEECSRHMAMGLSPTGKARQASLNIAMDNSKRAKRHPTLVPPTHWHIWQQQIEEGQRVTHLELLPRTYWTKSGANGRAKKDQKRGVFSVCSPCQDRNCPDYGRSK